MKIPDSIVDLTHLVPSFWVTHKIFDRHFHLAVAIHRRRLFDFSRMNRLLVVLLLCFGISHAFITSFAFKKQSSPLMMMAGFGASSKQSSKKEVKLKPKAQWDRYTLLKKEPIIRVAVRVVKEGEDWLEVGRVRSKDNQYTEIAIARQRAIIADVSVSLQYGCVNVYTYHHTIHGCLILFCTVLY
jgi:hypothetical protein